MPVQKRAARSTSKAARPSPSKKPRRTKIADESPAANASQSKSQKWVYPNLLEDKGQAEEMVLSHIIRAHSLATHDGQDDDEQDTAACAFEPTIKTNQKSENNTKGSEEDAPQSSKIVATCGGNTVCLIDCQLGRILAKYSHVEEEEFRCLAWTTLLQQVDDDDDDDDGDEESTRSDDSKSQDHGAKDRQHLVNILAAAGRLGSIKLINPLQNICYQYLHGHTAEVVQLRFSLNRPEYLYSASADGSIRLWDIGCLNKDGVEARCLAKLGGLDSPVTAMDVSEKYLVAGTATGTMARFNIRTLERKAGTRQTHNSRGSLALMHLKPDRIFPNSQEWHESAVDDILYLPRFSSKSYFRDHYDKPNTTKSKSKGKGKSKGKAKPKAKSTGKKQTVPQKGKAKGRGGRRAKESSEDEDEESDSGDDGSDSEDDDDDDDSEYIFASHESHQGEILIWDATGSTETDAQLKTILEWPISESQTRFSFVQNVVPQASSSSSSSLGERKRSRQNVLLVGSTTGEVLLYNLNIKPKRSKGNIVAQKPARILSSPMSTQLLRTITASEDISTIVAGDWTNRVLIWRYPSYLDV
ncbi:Leucine-rich repeats and WD repeat domain-containing protein 1 [Actinomortierella ambigua]|uniref:Leucine-rich repeats and WD repeat domain-containing protein 1 n=1 Tax=Actinomortierella ambigua TaxID=1343610 RepID=A0A9P6U5B7_9FUNG|nr:Leucine-rich repeats and WD repeat domain-containing protein 1 [Actinomortierella ambigua]